MHSEFALSAIKTSVRCKKSLPFTNVPKSCVIDTSCQVLIKYLDFLNFNTNFSPLNLSLYYEYTVWFCGLVLQNRNTMFYMLLIIVCKDLKTVGFKNCSVSMVDTDCLQVRIKCTNIQYLNLISQHTYCSILSLAK